VLHAGPWYRPQPPVEVDFGPPHTRYFFAPLQCEHREAEERTPRIPKSSRGGPDLGQFIIAQHSIASTCARGNRQSLEWISRDLAPSLSPSESCATIREGTSCHSRPALSNQPVESIHHFGFRDPGSWPLEKAGKGELDGSHGFGAVAFSPVRQMERAPLSDETIEGEGRLRSLSLGLSLSTNALCLEINSLRNGSQSRSRSLARLIDREIAPDPYGLAHFSACGRVGPLDEKAPRSFCGQANA
jgi:hypothetical protein